MRRGDREKDVESRGKVQDTLRTRKGSFDMKEYKTV